MITSSATLGEDNDYIRAIDFSQDLEKLYSISDNGFVRLWDITKQRKIIEANVIFLFMKIFCSKVGLCQKRY